jgi:hypothetical protein
VPNENDHQSVWKDFAKRFRSILQQHRNIGWQWELSQEQIGQLRDYFEGNILLLNCLELAVVADPGRYQKSAAVAAGRRVIMKHSHELNFVTTLKNIP